MDNSIAISNQYEGYRTTPILWTHPIYRLEQFQLIQPSSIPIVINPERRLGKRVEQFFVKNLEDSSNYNLICKNLQLKSDKVTIGEIDCIVERDSKFIHIEHVFKFYLYDPNVGNEELDHWIGPNRKDSLIYKLDKLKNKQLPILRSKQGLKMLDDYDISIHELEQKVFFKAQLFVPTDREVSFNKINSEAVKGRYYRLSELPTNAVYYLPNKIDWLLDPVLDVDWQSFNQAHSAISDLLSNKKSPICWIKSDTGDLEKCFVVWW